MKTISDLAHIIKNIQTLNISSQFRNQLFLDKSGDFSLHYAPFEHVNENARVVILGITPGIQQAELALTSAAESLRQGLSPLAALEIAKSFASFGGTMRKQLVAMLDAVGLQRQLHIRSCAEFWEPGNHLAHFTSCLTYPVLHHGNNYTGSPGIIQTPWLKQLAVESLNTQIDRLPKDAIWIPLGKSPTEVLDYIVSIGRLSHRYILVGLPHPSGANAERIAAFLGTKKSEACSSRTNGAALLQARQALTLKIEKLKTVNMQEFTPAAIQAPIAIECIECKPPHLKSLAASQIRETKNGIKVPFSRDGSYFHRGLKTSSGAYRIGAKGEEKLVHSFDEALDHLRKMPVAQWRRPSATSGKPGIVSAVRWDLAT